MGHRVALCVIGLLAASCDGGSAQSTDGPTPADAVRSDALRGDGCPVEAPTTGASCGGYYQRCVYSSPAAGLAGCRCESSHWACETFESSLACPPTKPVPGNDPVANFDAGIVACFYYYGSSWDFQVCTPCQPHSPVGNWACNWWAHPMMDGGGGSCTIGPQADAGPAAPTDAATDQ